MLFLFHFSDSNMQYVPQWRHNAIPEEDVVWVNQYIRDNNVSPEEGMKALHKKLLPKIESPHPWQQKCKYGNMLCVFNQ